MSTLRPDSQLAPGCSRAGVVPCPGRFVVTSRGAQPIPPQDWYTLQTPRPGSTSSGRVVDLYRSFEHSPRNHRGNGNAAGSPGEQDG